MADEDLAIIAKALLALSDEAATCWDYGGEQAVAKGVDLGLTGAEMGRLRELAKPHS